MLKLSVCEHLIPGDSYEKKFEVLDTNKIDAIDLDGNDLARKYDTLVEVMKISPVRISAIRTGYRGCLLDDNPEQRNLAVGDIKKLLDYAGKLNAAGVVVVPIYGAARLPDLHPLKGQLQVEEEMLTLLLSTLAEYAWKQGTRVLLQPMNRYETHLVRNVNEAVYYVNRVDHPGLRIATHVFHMNIEEPNFSDPFTTLGSMLSQIYLSDSNYQSPGYGHLNIKHVFDQLQKNGYTGYVTLDYIPSDKLDPLTELVSVTKAMYNLWW
ncbi:MAG: sugar phosphate isomerase/epimerase family protein [Elusimicrobiota bacterium]